MPGPNRHAEAFERVVFAMLLAGLAAAPFWLGSNRLVAWGANAAYWGVTLIVYEASVLAFRGAHPVGLAMLRLPALAILAVIAWIGLQAVAWTPQAWHHPMWQLAAGALHTDAAGAISLHPGHTKLALLRLVTALAVFWLALQLLRSPQRASLFLSAMAVIGAAYAGYGLIAFLYFPDSLLWLDKLHYQRSLTATFVNRNSYATYAGMTLVAGLGAVVATYRGSLRAGGAHVRLQLASMLAATAGRGGLLLLACFVIAIALILTGSRAGILASLAGLVAFAAMLVLRRGRHAWVNLAVLAVALATVGATLLGFGDTFVGRMADLETEHDDRAAVYRLTVQSIADSPLLGSGYGTFQDVFPMYRSTEIGPKGVWDKAHDTYLELFQGLGVPAALVFLGAAGWVVLRSAHGALTRARDAIFPATAAGASAIVLLHAFVDFSLQIQAVTLTWAALLGMGLAQSWSSRRATRDLAEPPRKMTGGASRAAAASPEPAAQPAHNTSN